MHLNHINLCASDVRALKEAFEEHFGYRTLASGKVPDYPGVSGAGGDYAMLGGEDGSYIVISQIPPSEQSAYPPHFHFGIMQDSAEAVYAKHDELTAAGYQPGKISANFQVLGAEWTAFTCPLGDGLEIEINYRTRSEVLDS